MAQVELLLALHDHQPVRVGQLANMLRLAPTTVSGLVQVLVEAGARCVGTGLLGPARRSGHPHRGGLQQAR